MVAAAGARLRIFSRWGQPVYKSSPYRHDWADGREHGPHAVDEKEPLGGY